MLATSIVVSAQFNVDRLIMSGRVALHYEDYVLSIQYFNQALVQKPFLYEPWQLRGIAKFCLDDYNGAEVDASEAINLNPYIPQIYDLRGISRIRLSKYEDAIKDYDRAIELLPTVQNYWYNRAICRMEMKDYDKANEELDVIIRKWRKFASPYLLKAEIALQQQDTLLAANWIDSTLTVDAYNADAWRVRAHIYFNKEEWKDAERCYSKLLHFKPKNVEGYLKRAVSRLRLNNLRGSMSDYDTALEIDPNNLLGHYNRGLLRQQVGDDNRAIEDFNFVLKHEPDNVLALFNRATLLDRVGDLRAAIRDYSKVIEEFPNFWTGLHYRAGCYRRLGMNAKAEMDEFRILKAQMDKHLGKQPRWSRKKLAEIRKKSELDPDKYNELVVEDDSTMVHEYKSDYRGRVQNRSIAAEFQPYVVLSPYSYSNALTTSKPYSREVDVVNSHLKTIQLQLATLQSSIEPAELARLFAHADTLTSHIQRSRAESEAKYMVLARGAVYSVMQNYQDALLDIDVYLAIDSTSSLAWWQRAVSNARLAEFDISDSKTNVEMREAGVISDFNSAMRYAPDNAYILYCRGTFHAVREDYAEAVKWFTKAIELDPRLPEAYFNRGLCYQRLGQASQANADLSKAGELGLYSAYSIMKKKK